MAEFLPFTLNNWRSVNLRLLKLIIGDGTEKTLENFYNALDNSVTKDENGQRLFTYAALKKAIQRDKKNLELAKGDNAKLKKLLGGQKTTKMQMRITPHQFLLQNALYVLGTTFESLFDRKKLGSVDMSIRPSNKNNGNEKFSNEELFRLIERLEAKIDMYTTSATRKNG
jgi:hypothetical protein